MDSGKTFLCVSCDFKGGDFIQALHDLGHTVYLVTSETTKENEKRLQLLIDSLPAQISYVNAEERYVLVNQEFEKSFDRTRDQIIGQRMENN